MTRSLSVGGGKNGLGADGRSAASQSIPIRAFAPRGQIMGRL